MQIQLKNKGVDISTFAKHIKELYSNYILKSKISVSLFLQQKREGNVTNKR